MSVAVTGELVAATRTARKQSRKLVAAQTGLTEAKIWNIEKGRSITDDELERLARWLLADGDGAAPLPRPSPPTEPSQAPPEPPPIDPVAEPNLGALYASVTALPEHTELEAPVALPIVSTPLPDWAESLLDPGRTDVRLFSNSEVQTFKQCRRKWWLGWFRGLRPRVESPVGPMAVGIRGHRALAQWYAAPGTPRTNPRDALERLITSDWSALVKQVEVSPELEKKFTADADLERIIMQGYVEWLAESGDDSDLEIIASETVLARPVSLNNSDKSVYFIGRLDARVRRKSDGAFQFIDHKFVAEFTTPTRVLHLDEQMLGYHLLEQENLDTLERSGGALYNMLRRVKRTPQAKPPFFLRVFVGHNSHEIDSYRRRSNATIYDITTVENELRSGGDHLEHAYPTPTRDCAWRCPFFAVCGMIDDGSRAEAMLESYYVQGDPRDYYRRELTGTRNEE